MPESLAGRLLVSTPQLTDPNFVHTVLLILQHGPDGALGVVLNRPSPAQVGDALPGWAGAVVAPPVLFGGGPVGLEGALCLGRLAASGDRPPGWQDLELPALPGLGLVDLDGDPEVTSALLDRVRIFAGYSGWGKDQLDGEVQVGGWYVLDALPRDPFTERPDDLWGDVLRRQGGELAMLSTLPIDPHLN